jgi:hypothetical protein
LTTKELIEAELSRMSEQELDELYKLIKGLIQSRAQVNGQSILVKLQGIQFDGPEDLAENHDLYLSGEKREE